MAKVTKKDLQSLIEGVLSEVINVNIGDLNLDLPTATKDKENPDEPELDSDKKQAWRDLGVTQKFGTKDKSEPYQALAGLADPKVSLSTADIESLFKNIRDGVPVSDQRALAAVNNMAEKGSDGVKAAIKKIFDRVIKVTGGSENIDTSQLSTAITSQIDPDRDSGQRVDPIGSQEMPRRSLETSEADFKAGNMPKASPNLVDLFGSVKGESIQEKLNSIAKFSEAAEKPGGIQEWASEKGRDKFAAFTYAKVLNFLATIKTTGATEAGFEFERWLALLLNIPVAGAEQGAADNLGKIGSDIVYTSAKLYTDIYGEGAPSQNIEKLYNTTRDKNKMYYFIAQKITGASAGGQEGKVQGYHFVEAIDLYMVEISESEVERRGKHNIPLTTKNGLRVYQDAAGKEYYVDPELPEGQTKYNVYMSDDKESTAQQASKSSIDKLTRVMEDRPKLQGRFIRQTKSGLAATKPYILDFKKKKGEVVKTQMLLTPQIQGDPSKNIFVKIYLPQGEVTDNQLQNTAEYLASEVDKIDDNVTKAIMNAARSIANMKADTESYAGKSVKEKGGASDYINKIAKSHKSLVTLYNVIFQYGEGDKKDRTTKFDRSIKESKITVDHIKKLIEEKFKK